MKLSKYLALAVLFGASLSANATLYQFSYAFDQGDWRVGGTFEGTSDGDLINIYEFETLSYTTLHDGSGSYTKDGIPGLNPTDPGMFTSFSGTAQHFNIQSAFQGDSLLVEATGNTISSRYFTKFFPSQGRDDSPINATWSVTAAVPEPTAGLMLLSGLGAVGFMARRKKARDREVAG